MQKLPTNSIFKHAIQYEMLLYFRNNPQEKKKCHDLSMKNQGRKEPLESPIEIQNNLSLEIKYYTWLKNI